MFSERPSNLGVYAEWAIFAIILIVLLGIWWYLELGRQPQSQGVVITPAIMATYTATGTPMQISQGKLNSYSAATGTPVSIPQSVLNTYSAPSSQ